MKKNLIICNTPYQVILAIMLKMGVLQEESVDIVITDMFSDAHALAKRVKKEDLFSNVYFVKDRDIQDGTSKKSKVIKIASLVFCNISSKKIWGNDKVPYYDAFYYCVPNLFMHNVFVKLKKINPELDVYIYEEGYSTYTGTVGSSKTDSLVNKRCKILRYPNVSKCLTGILLFEPDLLIYNYHCPTIRMSRSVFNDKQFQHCIKRVFNITKDVTRDYEVPYILIEESFYMKHPQIDDIELYEKIIDCVGADNIMVKFHPRSRTNRFKGFGIRENHDKGIPWEALFLTQGFQEKTLFALSSGSVINAGLCFGSTLNSFLLYKCLKNRPAQLDKDFETFVERFAKLYPNTICIPDSVESALKALKK